MLSIVSLEEYDTSCSGFIEVEFVTIVTMREGYQVLQNNNVDAFSGANRASVQGLLDGESVWQGSVTGRQYPRRCARRVPSAAAGPAWVTCYRGVHRPPRQNRIQIQSQTDAGETSILI